MSWSTVRADLKRVQAKIEELLTTGQEYTVIGSHTLVNPLLKDLRADEARLKNKILRGKGYSSKGVPDYR